MQSDRKIEFDLACILFFGINYIVCQVMLHISAETLHQRSWSSATIFAASVRCFP